MTAESCNLFRFVIDSDYKVTICQDNHQVKVKKIFVKMKKNVVQPSSRSKYAPLYAYTMYKPPDSIHSLIGE